MTSEVAGGLLARAKDDAAAARATLAIGAVTDAIVGFHAQQAVEKSLKAVLAAHDFAFPFTHDVEGLLELCAASGLQPPADVVRNAGFLTPYAVRHRYGGDPPTLVARADAVRLAHSAVNWADRLLADPTA